VGSDLVKWSEFGVAGRARERDHILEPGDYQAHLGRDRKDDPAAVVLENSTVNGTGSQAVDLSAGGGFIGRFTAD
jgi:hypothetical protein